MPAVSAAAISPLSYATKVVLVFEGGDEMVIHAMPARKKYLDLLP